MTRDDLLQALQRANVQAFLRLIREGESSQDESAYSVMFGGDHFNDFADHPRIKNTRVVGGKELTSTAAGAYQFIRATWDEMASLYKLPDFSPINQDCAAVGLIYRRKALDQVIAGRINEAIRRCGQEWASLPGSGYGQPTQALAKALAVYEAHGGRIEAAAVVATTSKPPARENVMGPLAIIPLVLDGLSALLPALSKLGFGSGSEVATRNIAAGAMVAEKLVQVTNAVNIQEAAEKIQNDPQALQAAKDAVAEVIGIVEAGGGGIKAAREQSALSDGNWRKAFLNPAFVIGLLIVFLVAFVVVVIVLGLGSQTWSDEIKAMVVTAIVTGGLGSVLGFFLGSSLGSQRKDALLAAK